MKIQTVIHELDEGDEIQRYLPTSGITTNPILNNVKPESIDLNASGQLEIK